MYTRVSQYIFNKEKNSTRSMGQPYPHSTRWEVKIVVIIYSYRAKEILYFFAINKTPNMSNDNYNRV